MVSIYVKTMWWHFRFHTQTPPKPPKEAGDPHTSDTPWQSFVYTFGHYCMRQNHLVLSNSIRQITTVNKQHTQEQPFKLSEACCRHRSLHMRSTSTIMMRCQTTHTDT